MPRFQEADIRFYALSYDDPDALADFASAHGITFPLLSDPDSELIRAFGILNTTIPADDHPWYGIPFPGVYVIDGNGVIVDKMFEQNLAVRTGPEPILASALGRPIAAGPGSADDASVTDGGPPIEDGTDGQVSDEQGPVEQVTDGEVSVEVGISDGPMPIGVTREITATFTVPAGQHLYGPPDQRGLPDGLIAASIEIDDDSGVLPLRHRTPPTVPLTLDATGHTLAVYEGHRVVIGRAVAQNGSAMAKNEDGSRWVTVSGTVRWQACDDTACFLPSSRRFSFRVPAAFAVIADAGPAKGRVPAMNGEAHFRRMVERRGIDPG